MEHKNKYIVQYHARDFGKAQDWIFRLMHDYIPKHLGSIIRFEVVPHEQIEKLQKQNEIMKDALEKAVSSAEFFMKFADCNRDLWSCRCEFCRDTTRSKNLREAREALKQIEEIK
jgi:predicted nucleotidyltransferase